MWTNIHDEIWEEIHDWTVKDLFSYKADRLHRGHLSDILEAVVQDLYEARYTEEERDEIEQPYYEEKWAREDEEYKRTYKGSYREALENGVSFSDWMLQQRS